MRFAAMTFTALFLLVVATEFAFAMQLYALSEKYHGAVPAARGIHHAGNTTLSRCTLICTAANCTTLFYHSRLQECRLYNHRPYNLKLKTSDGWVTYHVQGEIRSWAKEVLGVSSQYEKTKYQSHHWTQYLIVVWWFACFRDPKSYASRSLHASGRGTQAGQVDGWTPERALGKPDLYPEYKDEDFAWAPLEKSSPHEWIALGFEETVYIREIHVYETFNAGAVSDVSGRRPDGSWHSLWSTERVQYIQKSRIFKPDLKRPFFKTSVIRISIDGSECKSWPEIDAVQIIGDFRAY